MRVFLYLPITFFGSISCGQILSQGSSVIDDAAEVGFSNAIIFSINNSKDKELMRERWKTIAIKIGEGMGLDGLLDVIPSYYGDVCCRGGSALGMIAPVRMKNIILSTIDGVACEG